MFLKVLMYEDRTQNYTVSKENRRTIKLVATVLPGRWLSVE